MMDGFWNGARMALRIMIPLDLVVFFMWADLPWLP